MAKRKYARQLATRFPMMPHDKNGQGHIFGGVLLSHIDVAGAIAAHLTLPELGRLVTRAMGPVQFTKPVLVNDIVTCWGQVTSVGRTSVALHIDVEVDRAGVQETVTQADVVYVCVDENGKPQPIPGRRRRRRPQPVPPPPVVPDPAARVLAIRKTMMPADTNGMGNIFGGVLLSHMDLAGSYVARRACSNGFIRLMATRVMDRIEFKQPVHVSDVISCYGTVTHIGNTSVTVHVEVEADRAGTVIPVTSCDMVFVALGEDGKPTNVLCSTTNACGAGQSRARTP